MFDHTWKQKQKKAKESINQKKFESGHKKKQKLCFEHF